MSKTNELSTQDKQTIKDWNDKFAPGLMALEKARSLGLNDYLVLYEGYDKNNMKLQVNSYGAPVKYKVVAISEYGIPFLKKVNKKGTAVGKIYSCTGSLDSDDYRYSGGHFEFRLDPDYADAILLDDEYDPAQLHRTKQEIFKEVTKHNKQYKVPTSNLNELVTFFEKINTGDMLWTSTSGHFLVQEKESLGKLEVQRQVKDHYSRVKGPFITVLTVLDKKGKTFKITADFFYCKALYTERPRSYKELKI